LAKNRLAVKRQTKQNKSLAKRRTDPVESVYRDIAEILNAARSISYRAINTTMVQAYWQIGRVIVEDEQKGNRRAGYGAALFPELSNRLTRISARVSTSETYVTCGSFISLSQIGTHCVPN